MMNANVLRFILIYTIGSVALSVNAALLLNIYDIDLRYQYCGCSNLVCILKDLSHIILGCACLRGYIYVYI